MDLTPLFDAIIVLDKRNMTTNKHQRRSLDDDDASYPGRTGRRVSFKAGKLKVKQTG